jgi:hypothetical protein
MGLFSMSNKAISLARKVRGISSGAMHQLLLLADHADDQFRCWPSQQTLADDQGVSVDTVQRRNAELETAGILKQRRRGNKRGGRASNIYTLILNAKGRVKPQHSGLTGEVKPQSCGLYKEPSTLESSNIPRRSVVGVKPRQGVVSVTFDVWARWNELHEFLDGYGKAGGQTVGGIIKITRDKPDWCSGDGNFTADEILTYIKLGWLRRETYDCTPTPKGKWLRSTAAGDSALDQYTAMAA